MTSSVDTLLQAARSRLDRVTPHQAAARQRDGALLVDTRCEALRRRDGSIPGALIIERNVLEWRLDPKSDARVAEARPGVEVIVVCDEGYASSLAAASLLDAGVARATDLAGGFQAWRAAGLPVLVDG
jgi:rhodanese-related sulfurtransferase